jgi:hypothetical protein
MGLIMFVIMEMQMEEADVNNTRGITLYNEPISSSIRRRLLGPIPGSSCGICLACLLGTSEGEGVGMALLAISDDLHRKLSNASSCLISRWGPSAALTGMPHSWSWGDSLYWTSTSGTRPVNTNALPREANVRVNRT